MPDKDLKDSTTAPCTPPTQARISWTSKILKHVSNFFDNKKQDDTKTIFDCLRNMGICIAMLLGLPRLYSATDYLGSLGQTICGVIVIGSAVALAIVNFAWVIKALKGDSSVMATLLLLVIGVFVMGVFIIDAVRLLPCN